MQTDFDTKTIQGLREYYHRASLVLWNSNCLFERHIEELTTQCMEQFQEPSEVNETVLNQEWHRLNFQTTSVLRYAMLPRFVGLTEYIVKAICRIADADACRALAHRSWFKEHIRLLTKLGVPLDGIADELENFKHLEVLRNCVVHANGDIDACKDPNRVANAIDAIDTADRFRDGFVWLGDQVIPTAQLALGRIAERLFQHFGYPLDIRRFG